MLNFKQLLNNVKAFAFDVDGVFANSSVLLAADGELMRTMNSKDGFATQLAIKKGYPIAIITGGRTESIRKRFIYLGVKYENIYLGSRNKIDDFESFIFANDLQFSDVLYMGDDLPDYEVMQKVGVAVCPADAVPEIKAISHYISQYKGGNGCVRDILEQVMKLQGKWNDKESFSW